MISPETGNREKHLHGRKNAARQGFLSQMVNARIQFEQIDEKTFADLKELVIEQAGHHSSKYAGDDKKFVEALQRKDAVPQILMVRNDDTKEPLGYILFNHYHGFKGQELYIEDILVSGRERSQGFGLAMTEELKAKGRELGIDGISWTVAENNPAAIRFYENKMHAHPLPFGVYDCGDLYQAAPVAQAGITVKRVDAHDLDLVESYIGRIPGLTAEKIAHIRDAAAAENAAVYIASGDDGTPKAMGITNSNYSSFRTVYGYKFEMMELSAKDDADAASAFRALADHVVETGKATAHTGHLNIYIDKTSSAQKLFMDGLGYQPLQMTDDKASVFLLYGIGRDNIYAPKPQNVVNKKPPEGPKQ